MINLIRTMLSRQLLISPFGFSIALIIEYFTSIDAIKLGTVLSLVLAAVYYEHPDNDEVWVQAAISAVIQLLIYYYIEFNLGFVPLFIFMLIAIVGLATFNSYHLETKEFSIPIDEETLDKIGEEEFENEFDEIIKQLLEEHPDDDLTLQQIEDYITEKLKEKFKDGK